MTKKESQNQSLFPKE